MIWHVLSLEMFLNMSKYQHQITTGFREVSRSFTNMAGSVLVYLIVVILIFGVLGVTMVSLFTTATTSSAIPNDARRACFMAESATRYAFSELRDNDFNVNTINGLNSTTFKVTDAGSFTVNVFSLWFESPIDKSSSPYTLNIPAGILPQDSFVPINPVDPKVWAINFEYTEIPPISMTVRSPIKGYSRINNTTLIIDTSNDIEVAARERVCLAVQPSHDHTVSENGDLYVERVANEFFPRFNGAININKVDYSYERLVDEPGNNRVKLKNLTASNFSNTLTEFPLSIEKSLHFIVLSPRNYTVIPTGQSESASCRNDYKSGMNIFNPSEINAPLDITAEEFTDNISEVETNPNVITPIPDDDTLDIGGSHSPGSGVDFGAGWYSGNQSIGGNTNVCATGRCIFGLGIRVFFTLTYSGDGDGFTFTMMNADPTVGNDITSIGGDPHGSELLAYAGDSREDPAGTTFLDNNGGRGIVPPKLAVEFDAKTNFDQIFEVEKVKNYCDGPNLRQNTRNDPLPGGTEKDTVQFVYWADRNPIDIPCRPNGKPIFSTASYDDNRHASSADPINERDLFLTDSELDITPSNNWLNDGPWAIRLEVERSLVQNAGGNYDYNLQLWMRQCARADCNDILGTFFQDTRIKYEYSALPDLPLDQEIELSQSDHDIFNRFLFGFTTAIAPGDTQSALVEQFNLSFIRPNDPVITNDPAWPPL